MCKLKNSDLAPNTTYYWMISLTNGADWAQSSVWTFTTRLRDCTSVPCSTEHGSCNENNLECDCDYGYSGDDCSVQDKGIGKHLSNFLMQKDQIQVLLLD